MSLSHLSRTYLDESGCEIFTITDITPDVTISPVIDKVAIVLSPEDCSRAGIYGVYSVSIKYMVRSPWDERLGRITIKIVTTDDRVINGIIDVPRLSKLYLDMPIPATTSLVDVYGSKEHVGVVIAWLPHCSTNLYYCQCTNNIVTGGDYIDFIFTGPYVDKIYGGVQRDFIFSGTGSLDYINGGVMDDGSCDPWEDVAITSAPDSRVVNVERILRW